VKPEPQVLDVRSLLDAIREVISFNARQHSVTVTLDVPEDLPRIRGDRSQLTQVLVNLAVNGIEAMSESGGELTLRAGLIEGHVAIEVRDTGPGIPSDRLPNIWEAFYTTKAEGTGLGLSIVRSLVDEQPGAAIRVESTPGSGTTFTITMPAHAPE
jgi:signal transduction histidine kinase